MISTRDAAQALSIGVSAISVVAYLEGAKLAGLVVFGVCTAVFASTFLQREWCKRVHQQAISTLYDASALGVLVRGVLRPKVAARVAWGHNARPHTVRIRRFHTRSRIVTIVHMRIRRFLDMIVDAHALKRAYGELNPNMVRSVSFSGVATDLKKLRREAGTALIISGSMTGVAAVLLAIAVGMTEVVLLVLVPPTVMLFYPRIKLKIAASERKRALVDEMTFFAVYSLLLAEVGKTMVHALASISGRGIFPALEREATVMERGRGLGMGTIAALGDLGRNHPNPDFGALLSGYVAAFDAGDPKAHLKSQVDELLGRMHKRLEAYKEHSTSLCVMVAFTMFFLPVMMVPVAMIAGAKSAAFVSQVSFLAMPLMAVSVCIIAHVAQPKFGNSARFGWRVSLALSASAGIVAGALEPDRAWIVMAAAAITFSACSVAMTQKHRRVAASIDTNQGLFFRDITSRISAGDPSVPHAISKIASSEGGQYDKTFAEIIVRANFRIKHAGQTVQDVLADTARESWLGRFSFFLLSRIADTGSASAWVLTRTTEFVEQFVSAKRDVASSIKLYALISVVSPLGVVVMTWFLKHVLLGAMMDSPSVTSMSHSMIVMHASMSPRFDEAINSLTMASAICANVAVGKISAMSITDARPLLVGVAIALAAILAAPHLPAPALG